MKYEQAINIVFQRFPEFANSKKLEEGYFKDLPYSVYSAFAAYFIKIVNESKSPEKDPRVLEVCIFLDEMAKSEDKKTIDLLVAGFFEDLDWVREEARKPVAVLQKFLHEPARTYLKELIEWRPEKT